MPNITLYIEHACIEALLNYITGTHDIQNISVSSPLPGTVRVTGEFIEGSTATGVLIIVYSLQTAADDSDIQYIDSEYHDLNTMITVDRLTGGHYGVSVFVIENGLPFSRVSSLPQLLYTNKTRQSIH